MNVPSKQVLLTELLSLVKEELRSAKTIQEESQKGATHEEMRAEDPKDMRSTEISYLARGLAKRVMELEEGYARLKATKLRSFDSVGPIALTAIVNLEDEEGCELTYFLLPFGAGKKLGPQKSITVVTPKSPLGQKLVGAQADEAVLIPSPSGAKELTILTIM